MEVNYTRINITAQALGNKQKTIQNKDIIDVYGIDSTYHIHKGTDFVGEEFLRTRNKVDGNYKMCMSKSKNNETYK